MTDKRIDPEVIDAAEVAYDREKGDVWHRAGLEAAIRTADRERGLKEERRHPAIPIPGTGMTHPGPATHYRLVSDWRQVERGGEDG